jgi:hypothetical protein
MPSEGRTTVAAAVPPQQAKARVAATKALNDAAGTDAATPPLDETRLAAIPEGVGSLRVISLNGASQVYIDGEYIDWTPLEAISLPSGRHELVLGATEYFFEHREQVVVMPDEETARPIKRNYKPARVRFEGFPPEAEIELNGKLVGRLGDTREIHLDDLGDHQFTIRHERKLLKRLKLTFGVQSKDLKPGALHVIRPDR